MNDDGNYFNAAGGREVGTITAEAFKRFRAESDEVHVVQPLRSEGGWGE